MTAVCNPATVTSQKVRVKYPHLDDVALIYPEMGFVTVAPGLFYASAPGRQAQGATIAACGPGKKRKITTRTNFLRSGKG